MIYAIILLPLLSSANVSNFMNESPAIPNRGVDLNLNFKCIGYFCHDLAEVSSPSKFCVLSVTVVTSRVTLVTVSHHTR